MQAKGRIGGEVGEVRGGKDIAFSLFSYVLFSYM